MKCILKFLTIIIIQFNTQNESSIRVRRYYQTFINFFENLKKNFYFKLSNLGPGAATILFRNTLLHIIITYTNGTWVTFVFTLLVNLNLTKKNQTTCENLADLLKKWKMSLMKNLSTFNCYNIIYLCTKIMFNIYVLCCVHII